MHPDHDRFLAALHDRHTVEAEWRIGAGQSSTRLAAPLDFGGIPGKEPRYSFWLYPIGERRHGHAFSIPADKLIRLVLPLYDGEPWEFDPAEIVTWTPLYWHVPRTTWGDFNGEAIIEPAPATHAEPVSGPCPQCERGPHDPFAQAQAAGLPLEMRYDNKFSLPPVSEPLWLEGTGHDVERGARGDLEDL